MAFVTKEEFKLSVKLLRALYHLSRGECSTYTLVDKWAKARPSSPAVFYQDRMLTYSELKRVSDRVAGFFLELGAKPGDHAALFMGNCPEYLAAITGLNRLGMVASLINTHLRHRALAHALAVGNPRWILAGRSLAGPLEEVMKDLPEPRPRVFYWDHHRGDDESRSPLETAVESDEPLPEIPRRRPSFKDHILNIYTSGTTGLPKAARVSNRRMFFSGYALGPGLASLTREDVVYAPLPLYHSMAMFVSWASALAAGASIIVRDRFSASHYWEEARKLNATASVLIGEMPRYLLAQPPSEKDRDHKVRRVITAGLRGNIWEKFRDRFGIEQIYEFYGATETNVGIMNVEGRPGFVGRLMPLQSYVVKWDPVGERVIRNEKGRCMKCEPGEEGMLIGRINPLLNLLGFDGYLDEKETEKKILKGVFRPRDRFFMTGDVVKLHEDRWVSFVDRSGDTFRWKGENVSTQEVEMILDGCPGVEDVNVYGVKVPGQEGAAGMAAVVLKDSWNPEAVSRFVRDNLPHYARPLFIRLCKELPMTSTLKHQKFGLKKEGFNPQTIKDPLYFWDRWREQYIPLDEDLYEDIVKGNVKL